MKCPLVGDLAEDGVPVSVMCRVLQIARQPYYRWLAHPPSNQGHFTTGGKTAEQQPSRPELAHFSGLSVLMALDRLVSGGGGADLTH